MGNLAVQIRFLTAAARPAVNALPGRWAATGPDTKIKRGIGLAVHNRNRPLQNRAI
jgi:hypothetical protein